MNKTILFLAPLFLIACTAKPADVNTAVNNAVDAVEQREQAREAAQNALMEEGELNEQGQNDEQARRDAEVEQGEDGETVMNDKGQYTAYSEGVVGNGAESVLFFHADWCPNCRANDALLTQWYSENNYSKNVYKIDYDSNTDLKAQFGVTGQDTFVVIDGSGNVISATSFPSEEELLALLQ